MTDVSRNFNGINLKPLGSDPADPNEGDLWLGPLGLTVHQNGSTAPVAGVSSTPSGVILDFAGAVAPSGWLLCNGQILNAVTNPEYVGLYSVILNTFGGTNNTNFVVPDLRGRVTAGKDDMGGVAASRLTSGASGVNGAALGGAGGLETMLSHNHVVDVPAITGNTGPEAAHTHADGTYTTSIAGVTLPTAAHTHTEGTLVALGYFDGVAQKFRHNFQNRTLTVNREAFWSSAMTYSVTTGTVTKDVISVDGTTAGPSATTTSITGSNAVTGTSAAGSSHLHTLNHDHGSFNSANTGTGTTQGNVQPTFVLNKIIKY